jgi:hypothetical protein
MKTLLELPPMGEALQLADLVGINAELPLLEAFQVDAGIYHCNRCWFDKHGVTCPRAIYLSKAALLCDLYDGEVAFRGRGEG